MLGTRIIDGTLALLLPGVVRWAERRAAEVMRVGVPLSEEETELARRAGVKEPQRIRIEVRERIPMPGSRLLRVLAMQVGLSLEPVGLSLGYGIVVRAREGRNSRLITHEFVHTAQYERLGGMKPYLRQYLRECLLFGYSNAPMEEEAVVETGRIFGWNA
jgi:hypothetical protein